MEELDDLSIDDVVEGPKVLIEYTSVPYGGKQRKGKDEGFSGNGSLKLHSITVLGMIEERPTLDMSSPKEED